jgi:hypothetical protein
MRASLRLFCLRLFCWCALLVLPAGAATAATRSFTFTAADQGAVTGLSVVTAFTTTVRNTGTVTDTYTVTTVKEMPAAWSCSLCEGTICYPPFIQQISFNLAPGSETNVDIDLTPLAVEGAGVAHVTVASQGDPSLVSSREFRVVTTGVEVLLVDGDGGQSLEDYYAPALASGDVTWARWPRHEAGALASPELEAFAGVIWFGEAMEPALDEADRSALAYYVQHGGTLLLCGQDLAWQACSPASPWYSSQAAAWFQVVLGTAYAADATGAVEVAALPAAPVREQLVQRHPERLRRRRQQHQPRRPDGRRCRRAGTDVSQWELGRRDLHLGSGALVVLRLRRRVARRLGGFAVPARFPGLGAGAGQRRG